MALQLLPWLDYLLNEGRAKMFGEGNKNYGFFFSLFGMLKKCLRRCVKAQHFSVFVPLSQVEDVCEKGHLAARWKEGGHSAKGRCSGCLQVTTGQDSGGWSGVFSECSAHSGFCSLRLDRSSLLTRPSFTCYSCCRLSWICRRPVTHPLAPAVPYTRNSILSLTWGNRKWSYGAQSGLLMAEPQHNTFSLWCS